jgi:hypothetical protein
MRLSILVLVAQLATLLSAGGLAGAYERVYFYYAYLIDIETNGGTPSTIATGCRGASGGTCNFNEFMAHIDKYPQSVPSNILSDRLPSLDVAAHGLFVDRVTGDYNTAAILEGEDRAQRVITGVAKFLQPILPAIDPQNTDQKQMKAAVQRAPDRIRFFRQQARTDPIREALAEVDPHADVVTIEKTIMTDGTPYEFVDEDATAKANPTIDVKGIIKGVKDDGHKAMIKATYKASKALQC